MLSQEVQAVLRQQGWSPERKVSTRDWVAQLVGVGYTVLPQAESILQNFGILEITPVRTPNDAFAPQVVRFDPVTEVLSEVERIEFWQERLAQKLTRSACCTQARPSSCSVRMGRSFASGATSSENVATLLKTPWNRPWFSPGESP